MIRALAAASAVWLAAGCQDDVATPFPPGLEPLEDNRVPDHEGAPAEVLRSVDSDGDLIRVHGRGLVFAEPARVWELTQQPEAMVARCNTTERTITPGNDAAYAFSFLVHYVVRDLLTVEWDDQWRYGVISGTAGAPALGMIKHQKVQGSDLITLSTGTVQVLATDDPGVTELAFVEHLDAISGSAADVLGQMQHNYDALVALAHGLPIPPCP